MIHQYIERAKVLIEKNRYQLAEKELAQALAIAPESPEVLALLAVCRVYQNDFKQALHLAKQALGKSTAYSLPYRVIAEVHRNIGSFGEANKTLDLALKECPTEPFLYYMKARLAAEQYHWFEVIKYADLGLQLVPTNANLLNIRAKAHYKLSNSEEADRTLNSLLQVDPINSEALSQKGWIVLYKDQLELARQFFLDALALNPNNHKARLGILECIKNESNVYHFLFRIIQLMRYRSGLPFFAVMLGGVVITGIGFELLPTPLWIILGMLPIILLIILQFLIMPLFDLIILFKSAKKKYTTKKIAIISCVRILLFVGIIFIIVMGTKS